MFEIRCTGCFHAATIEGIGDAAHGFKNADNNYKCQLPHERGAKAGIVIVRLTKEKCPSCLSHHPASEGITIYTRSFECSECGETWEDVWCCDCDDKCPSCSTAMTSLEVTNEELIEEAVEEAA